MVWDYKYIVWTMVTVFPKIINNNTSQQISTPWTQKKSLKQFSSFEIEVLEDLVGGSLNIL